VQFPTPGAVIIDWGQESESCAFSANGSGSEWVLAMDCSGTPKLGRWTWIGEGRARSVLASDEPEVMVFLPHSFAEIITLHEKRFAEKKLPELVGVYWDSAGNELRLGADGTVTVGRDRFRATVLECLYTGAAAQMPHVPCLRLEDSVGRSLILAALPADSGAVLVEGSLPEETEVEGRAFQALPHARRFLRAPPPVSKDIP
jgi:hypothetical protein